MSIDDLIVDYQKRMIAAGKRLENVTFEKDKLLRQEILLYTRFICELREVKKSLPVSPEQKAIVCEHCPYKIHH